MVVTWSSQLEGRTYRTSFSARGIPLRFEGAFGLLFQVDGPEVCDKLERLERTETSASQEVELLRFDCNAESRLWVHLVDSGDEAASQSGGTR